MRKQVTYSLFLFLLLFIGAWYVNHLDGRGKQSDPVQPPPPTGFVPMNMKEIDGGIPIPSKHQFGPREYVKLKSNASFNMNQNQ